jgi:tape measure domain-containing protein
MPFFNCTKVVQTNKVEYQVSLKDLLSAPLRKADNNVHVFENDVDSATRSVERLKSTMSGIGSGGFLKSTGAVALGTLLTSAVESAGRAAVQQVKSILDAGLNASKVRAQYEVLTGSGEIGNKLYNDVNKYIQDSIFGPKLTEDVKTLLGFGFNNSNVLSTVKMLGDVAGGDEQKLSQFALQYGQIKSKGTLQGQESNSFAEGGFNIIQELARITGKTEQSLISLREQGGITFAMVEQAFKSATSEGGRFYNMVEKMGQTPFGKLQAMQGNIEGAKQKLGEALLPAMSDFMDASKPLIDALPKMFEQLKPTIEDAIKGFTSLAKWVGNNTSVIGSFAKAVKTIAEAYIIWKASTAAFTAAQFLYNISVEKSIVALSGEAVAINSVTAATERLTAARAASGLVNQYGVPIASAGAASTAAAGTTATGLGLGGLSLVGGALLVALSAASVVALSRVMADPAGKFNYEGGSLYDGSVQNSLKGGFQQDTLGYDILRKYSGWGDTVGSPDTLYNTKKRFVPDTMDVSAWSKMTKEQRALIEGMKSPEKIGDKISKTPVKDSTVTGIDKSGISSKVTGQQVKNIYVTINGGLIHDFTIKTTTLKDSTPEIKRLVTTTLTDAINDIELNN